VQGSPKHLKKLFIIFLILSALVLLYFSPLADGMMMGVVFAYVAKPIRQFLERKVSRSVSSFISTMVIILPIAFLMFYGVFQGVNQMIYVLTHQKQFEETLVNVLRNAKVPEKYVSYVVSNIPSIENAFRNALKVSAVNYTVKAVYFLLNFFVSAVVCFYALADGDRLLKAILSIVPEDSRGIFREIFLAIDETLVSLWFGNFAFAVLVGLVSIPYFMAFHVPYVPMLSGLMFLAALIPVFAEWMVIIPVSMYLATVNLTSAIWFFALGVVFFYILPELLLRPQFVGHASSIHPLLLLLAFIGGAMCGGAFGFFAAPTLVAVLSAVYPFLKSGES